MSGRNRSAACIRDFLVTTLRLLHTQNAERRSHLVGDKPAVLLLQSKVSISVALSSFQGSHLFIEPLHKISAETSTMLPVSATDSHVRSQTHDTQQYARKKVRTPSSIRKNVANKACNGR